MVRNKNNIMLVTIPNPILRKKSKILKKSEIDNSSFKHLIEDMVKIVHQYDGLGISAVQVGVLKKVFIIRKDPEKEINMDKFWDSIEIFINPEIIEYSKEKMDSWEGCLSIPGLQCLVERSKKIKVRYTNFRGDEVEEVIDDLKSIVFQHEYDHTMGILILDKAKEVREVEE